MKVSAFAPSDTDRSALKSVPAWPVVVIAALYFAAHLPFLAPSLEDIDSINFALGLRDFDPANHQPHPPGYPVYIGFGRVSLAVLTALFPSIEMTRAYALALSMWSAVGGAVAIVAAWAVFNALERFRQQRVADASRNSYSLWAVVLLAVNPLFWITGLRPMSDMPGLAVALVAQAFLLRAIQGRNSLVPGALATAIAAGLRTQSLMLTLPFLMWGIVVDLKTGGWRLLVWPATALVAGVLVWAVPLIAAAGGIEGYVQALGSQAGEDFGWVNMLWSNPTPRRLAFGLHETFVLPWASVPLAALISVMAFAGAIRVMFRSWRALAVLCMAFGPYLVFHLLFQETPFVRYALPVVPAIAWLSWSAIAALGKLGPPAGFALTVYAAIVSIPAGIAYGSEPHPAFRALADMAGKSNAGEPTTVYSHFALFRSLEVGASDGLRVVPPTRSYEWLGLVKHWRDGGTAPVWFLADPRRTDLALIDPQARRDRIPYRWNVADRPELGGTRPIGADWYRFSAPGWFAGEGWSLTAETGGLVRATARGVEHGPIEAFARRRTEPVSIMIGGRHIGAPDDPATEFTLSLDDAVVDSWTFDHRTEGLNFLRFIRLPGGIPSGPGDYARLTIAARSASADRPTPEVAIRQFDVQSPEYPIMGFGEGWHEDEYEVSSGLRWRWTSDRSTLRVISQRPVTLIVSGESPLKYFDSPPDVQIKIGARVIASFRPDSDFEWRVKIPAEDLANAEGAIVIEVDRVYLPGPAEGTTDARRLGLRTFDCRVEPVEN